MIRRVARRIRHLAGAPLRRVRRFSADVAQNLPTLRVVSRTLARNLSLPSLVLRRRIRVGVDVRPFYEPLTGIGWYLFHLLEELARDERFELIAFGEAAERDDGARLHVALPANVRLVTFDFHGTPVGRLTRPATSAAYPLLIWSQHCDVMFGANYFLPRALDAVARRRVVTVHDLTYRRFPELLQKETLENLESHMLRELTRADAVLCVSEATRRDLLEYYDIAPSRAVTILSGLAPVEVAGAPRVDLPAKYILFVSTIEPRKNVATLISAFEKVCERGEYDGDLVLVGRIGWKSDDVVDRLDRSRWKDRIHHLDYVSREKLAALYANAQLFVFPSIYEGFGFPLLEAMAHGIPSIAARSSSLPEVGGDAALYFDPLNVEALAARIAEVASSEELRADLSERGRRQAAKFRWSDTAKATGDVLERVARER